MVASLHDEVIGYVCGTLSASATLQHESMFKHDPSGGWFHSGEYQHHSCFCALAGKRRQAGRQGCWIGV